MFPLVDAVLARSRAAVVISKHGTHDQRTHAKGKGAGTSAPAGAAPGATKGNSAAAHAKAPGQQKKASKQPPLKDAPKSGSTMQLKVGGKNTPVRVGRIDRDVPGRRIFSLGIAGATLGLVSEAFGKWRTSTMGQKVGKDFGTFKEAAQHLADNHRK